ncbi:cell envelope integrity protein CreD [uncultured Arcticibacterium sp.]|uniref:cell envelope integrity protein CreD n=1 Tax=uncultured Arcticibacterium sp. TaxID=2173042 RepID=UPI0030F5C0BE
MEEKPSFYQRNQLLIKGALIGFLVLLLMIPTFFIRDLISERQLRKSEVLTDISQKWGRAQTINGPLLKVPYFQKEEVQVSASNGTTSLQIKKVEKIKYFSPQELNVSSNLIPQKRKRGIFEVIVYESENHLSGNFKFINDFFKDIPEGDVEWNKAELILGFSDLRGINSEVKLLFDNKEVDFAESRHIAQSFGDGIIAPLDLSDSDGNGSFDISLRLNGSEELNFVALAKQNNVEVTSNWDSPKFFGEFLPFEREVNKDGFNAKWQVSHLNRNLPETWSENSFPSFRASTFGVSLINPNNNYQKSERSVKYAILVIGLTFLAFFFGEILKNQKIHVFQYILVGFALCIFYTLLISMSEIWTFNLSYGVSAAMTLILTFFYSRSIFQNTGLALGINGVLAALYAFIFVIIQLEDTALLIGSLGLFVILAITMYVSRKINWYK